jgi:uncharacterized protein (UPF0332 family)
MITAKMINASLDIRRKSDYTDTFDSTKEETEAHISNAEMIVGEISNYISLRIEELQYQNEDITKTKSRNRDER